MEFEPATIGTNETKALISVKKGEVCHFVKAQKLRLAGASTTSTMSLGDGGDVDRYIAVTDTETGAVDDIVQPVVAYFPYCYTADDTIDLDYIAGATPGSTKPKWRVTIAIKSSAQAASSPTRALRRGAAISGRAR